MEHTRFIGLDVHKETISVAIAETGRNGNVSYHGEIANDALSINKLCNKLGRTGKSLVFCYEAGPCGYNIYRQLNELGYRCDVVAPSLIPVRSGDRVKTDRRDATMLARLHRAGELTSVWVPDVSHEAMRDLIRLRSVVRQILTRARQHLQGFLLRHGRKHGGGTAWGLAYRRWLSTLSFDHSAQQIAFQDYVDAVTDAERRLQRVEQQIIGLLPEWNLRAVVDGLQAMRGIALINAVVLAAEVGDFTRFSNPRELMAYFGLVPGERSSGSTVRRGGITKTGNSHVRRALVEGAWSYRMKPRVGRHKVDHIEALPKNIRDIGWKAQVRLCTRYRRLSARGKTANVINVAIAREMVGFIWSIGYTIQSATNPA
ncbi:MAG: IS110 family transposase [Alphaproteobacteria bacterium]|nr:IS110 family transposase [Alphaproteobacteria bacterium]